MSTVRKLKRQMKAHQKAVERAEAPEKPIGPIGRAINWLWARAPLPERLKVRIIVAKMNLKAAWVGVRPGPEEIGKRERGEMRPVEIELGFFIYPDGDVVYRNRWGGDIKIDNQDVIDMVHHEYNCLVRTARQAGALR